MTSHTITRKEYNDICLDEHGKFRSPFRDCSMHDLVLQLDLIDRESRDNFKTLADRLVDIDNRVSQILDILELGGEVDNLEHKIWMLQLSARNSQRLLRDTLERIAMPDIAE